MVTLRMPPGTAPSGVCKRSLSPLTPKKAGYATITGPKGTKEYDTCTCAHDNRVWVVRSSIKGIKADPGGFCRLCMKMICPRCVGKACVPFERKLKIYEDRQRMLREAGV